MTNEKKKMYKIYNWLTENNVTILKWHLPSVMIIFESFQ